MYSLSTRISSSLCIFLLMQMSGIKVSGIHDFGNETDLQLIDNFSLTDQKCLLPLLVVLIVLYICIKLELV